MAKTLDTTQDAERFYEDALQSLRDSEVPFMVGGAYAMREYADIHRDTKDLDVFCKAGDYPRLLEVLGNAGYTMESTDARWLAKAFKGEHYIDIIFNSANGRCPIDDTWFEHAPDAKLLGKKVKLIPAEEMVWTKACVQDRYRFDGADIYHVLRKSGEHLDWQRLLQRMEPYWEVLLAHLLQFRFVYPSDRDAVPKWLMEELLSRVEGQLRVPTPQERVCRGSLLSRSQYVVDTEEWGYRES